MYIILNSGKLLNYDDPEPVNKMIGAETLHDKPKS